MAANVLIVDDSVTMRRMIKRTIEISGLDVAEVYEASNGIEALARMDQYSIGVVLLDINMPVMTGVQLIERLRDDERLREIPIIVASTEGSQTRITHLLEAGARGFIRKPFQPEQIRDALAPLVGLRAQPAQPAGLDESAF
ncbi:MAG TPA: response regulator [Phycisphaerae bacterium]|jgi:two-component system chemotaxis response regulator CheY|nr:response regulator [Phycisphaerae bacterium]HRT41188.1 response regulator [Phycisphaerae bacterium]